MLSKFDFLATEVSKRDISYTVVTRHVCGGKGKGEGKDMEVIGWRERERGAAIHRPPGYGTTPAHACPDTGLRGRLG
jgi:hypothetical protein